MGDRHGYIGKMIVKRSMDLALLVVASPIVVPVCSFLFLTQLIEQLVTWEFGPLVVSEPRISRGRRFKLYKLNMYREHVRQEYVRNHPEYQTQRTYAYLQKNEDSLTNVGKIMKKYYLDELGQILNILLGQMSFVGPRPFPEHDKINNGLPRQRLKAGLFCFRANRWKNEGNTILKHSTDSEYLELYGRSSTLELIKLDALLVLDGLRAVLKGKGK